jgi:CBS domain-containing protein
MSELAVTVSTMLKQKPRQIWSISPAASVYECLEMMAEKQVGALLVMDQGTLTGIISERDYARKVFLLGRTSKDTLVAEIMTSPVVTVTCQHTIGDCMHIVTDKRIRHLPVMDGDKVIGLISIGDLVNWVINEQQKTIMQLQAYICGTAS